MLPAFRLHDKAKMLHRIGEVYRATIQPGIFQRPIQHIASRSDEWLAAPVFFITRLFADQHNFSLAGSLTEDGLRRIDIQFASPAFACRILESRQSTVCRQVGGGGRPAFLIVHRGRLTLASLSKGAMAYACGGEFSNAPRHPHAHGTAIKSGRMASSSNNKSRGQLFN